MESDFGTHEINSRGSKKGLTKYLPCVFFSFQDERGANCYSVSVCPEGTVCPPYTGCDPQGHKE